MQYVQINYVQKRKNVLQIIEIFIFNFCVRDKVMIAPYSLLKLCTYSNQYTIVGHKCAGYKW